MKSVENYYEDILKGKNEHELMCIIRGLKNKIEQLKNIIEHPHYEISTDFCDEYPELYYTQSCLEKAKEALKEVGGAYEPTTEELKAQDFENNIQFINELSLCLGDSSNWHSLHTATLNGEDFHLRSQVSFMPKLASPDKDFDVVSKEYFYKKMHDLHIAEWKTNYSLNRFGYDDNENSPWDLKICFSNQHSPVEIHGAGTYPYNFEGLKSIFGIESDN